jgi:hypothetical protein
MLRNLRMNGTFCGGGSIEIPDEVRFFLIGSQGETDHSNPIRNLAKLSLSFSFERFGQFFSFASRVKVVSILTESLGYLQGSSSLKVSGFLCLFNPLRVLEILCFTETFCFIT